MMHKSDARSPDPQQGQKLTLKLLPYRSGNLRRCQGSLEMAKARAKAGMLRAAL